MLIEIFKTALSALRSVFQSRAALLAENVVLRQQIIVLQRSVPKPRIRARDRVVLALAARLFGTVLKAITIVRPETVVRWHRSFWRLIWRKKSGRPVGRPPADADVRTMIRRHWKENPLWGEDRIAGELCKLGYKVSRKSANFNHDFRDEFPDSRGSGGGVIDDRGAVGESTVIAVDDYDGGRYSKTTAQVFVSQATRRPFPSKANSRFPENWQRVNLSA
jgi:hypothetical protein